jgi:hypothetical protein
MCYEATKRVQNNQEMELEKCQELFKSVHEKDPDNLYVINQYTSNAEKNLKRVQELNERLRIR